VAFQDPQIRNSELGLQVAWANGPQLSGDVAVNRPLSLNGFDFYYVQHAFDQQGREYVGIQIVQDPGRPVVFLGMALAAVGAIMAACRRFYGVG
jgi:cytochrome c biogenesis protein ResB